MTKFQFIKELLNIIKALLQADITGCAIHETRGYLDELFNEFEENEGLPCDTVSDAGDVEMYSYVLDDLFQIGYKIWSKENEVKMAVETEEVPSLSDCFFPDLQDVLDSLTIFPKCVDITHG